MLVLVFPVLLARGQDVTGNLSQQEANDLFKSLNKQVADSTRAIILGRLAQYNILKAGDYQADMDSAAGFIEQARQINTRIHSPEVDGYLDLVEAFFAETRGQPQTVKSLLEKAIQVLQGTKDTYHLGQAYFELSQRYDYNTPDQLPVMVRLVNQAVLAFDQSGHTEFKAFSLKMLADLYNLQDEDSKAIKAITACLEAYQSIHYPQLQGVYDLFANLYSSQMDYKQAIHYEFLALRTAEAVHDSTMQLCEIYNHLATFYGALYESATALDYLKKALAIAVLAKDNKAIYLLATNMASSYMVLDKPKEALVFLQNILKTYAKPNGIGTEYYLDCAYLDIYGKTRQYQKAKPYCDRLSALMNGRSLSDGNKNYGYFRLINFYTVSAQYASALVCLKKNEAISLKLGDYSALAVNFSSWYKLDSTQKHFESAFNNLLKSRRITDSLFNETKSRQIRQMEAQYDSEQKENQLKLQDQSIRLLNQRSMLQQNNLQRANLLKNMTLGGVLLLVVITGLLYKQYRQKRRSNQVITQKNKMLEHLVTDKEWLLKEVHHRVKNNLQIVISLLNTQSKYLDNEEALSAISESRHRMQAMSFIHQKLYQSDNVAFVNMQTYIRELVDYLDISFGRDNQIRFSLEVESVDLDISQAIPVGLILNEAITNAIKHAFSDREEGTIMISMKHLAYHRVALTIRDDGRGLPDGHDLLSGSSMGLRLIVGLIGQLEAAYTIRNDQGFYLHMEFEQDLVLRKVAS